MGDLISRNDVMRIFTRYPDWEKPEVLWRELRSLPSVDAVPVVRCRNCKYCDPSNGIFWCDRFDSAVQIDGMAYCSYGKQKLKED